MFQSFLGVWIWILHYVSMSLLSSLITVQLRKNLFMKSGERSNRMSLMIIKHSISDTIRDAMPEEENAKKFLSQIADRYVASEKAEACTLLSKLVTMRYNGKGNIREYIMEMSNLVTKMKALKLEFSQEILVYLVLILLPTQFGPFKINYNTQREK
ncbi:hypothetical protein Vadar_014647 [Vaccinium darrowii]|uniref:Uncharacterized protein n=1 Tax=Vaccinium darrowii TaxID=229202 RepID=A0ACB7XQV4_9ERIC|nr:hypothetical protein Vadar_014647 [Vaccinium darrowii]